MVEKAFPRLSFVAAASVLAASFCSPVAFAGTNGSADGTMIQAPADQPRTPPLVKPPVEPPANDDQGPLLTPGIRPRGQAPDVKPDQDRPERKAEPKNAPPGQKDARPAPKGDTKPDLHAAPKDGLPKSDPKAPPAKSATKSPADKPGLAVAQPRTPAEREKALSDLYAYLATAEDAKQAQTISSSIERLWVASGSDTVSLLMQRAMHAANTKDVALAIKLLDSVVALAPDYAEGWNRRAYVRYTQNEIDLALGDLRRTLALDPNHFKALDGLVHILKDIGRKKEALQAARRLLDVNPYYDGAKQIVDELSREIEGRGI